MEERKNDEDARREPVSEVADRWLIHCGQRMRVRFVYYIGARKVRFCRCAVCGLRAKIVVEAWPKRRVKPDRNAG